MNEQQLKAFPKVELHCHLDGSISQQTLKQIYEEQGDPLRLSDDEIHRLTVAANSCTLTAYIDCFRIVAAGLKTQRALQLALLDVVRQAAAENILYLEIRLSPLHLAGPNLRLAEVAEALIEACHLAEKSYPIKVRLIFCCMRRQLEKDNKAVIDLAKQYFGTVVAIDLAGDESRYLTKDYQVLFSYAERLGIPYTIHAGETGSLTSVLDALAFGAKRIGHGIALMQSEKAMELAAKQEILLEMCPVCNIQTGAAADWEHYPIALFLEKNLSLCLNTDNRTVSKTTLTNEFLQVHAHGLPLTSQFMLAQTKTAIKYSFADDSTKQFLLGRAENAVAALSK